MKKLLYLPILTAFSLFVFSSQSKAFSNEPILPSTDGSFTNTPTEGGLDIEVDRKNNYVAVFSGSEENPGVYIAISHDLGQTWTTTLLDKVKTEGTVNIVTLKNGFYIVVYDDFDSGSIKMAKSVNSGLSWEISTIFAGPGLMASDLSVDFNDFLYTVYWDSSDESVKFSSSTLQGTNWSEPSTITKTTNAYMNDLEISAVQKRSSVSTSKSRTLVVFATYCDNNIIYGTCILEGFTTKNNGIDWTNSHPMKGIGKVQFDIDVTHSGNEFVVGFGSLYVDMGLKFFALNRSTSADGLSWDTETVSGYAGIKGYSAAVYSDQNKDFIVRDSGSLHIWTRAQDLWNLNIVETTFPDTYGHASPEVAVDSRGRILVLYYDLDETCVKIATSEDPSEGWVYTEIF